MHTTVTKSARALAVAAIAVVSTVGFGAASAEAGGSKPILQVDGGTSYTVNSDGDAVVTGPANLYLRHRDESIDATITATLSPADGTLPEAPDCEPAKATFVIKGVRSIAMRLVGHGEVCGEFPQPPTSVVTHVFTGRYEVVHARRAPLEGTDGFFEVRLGLENVASAFAIDT